MRLNYYNPYLNPGTSRRNSRNLDNLISNHLNKSRYHNQKHFVPSILLSNIMLLVPKIDEIADTIGAVDVNIAFLTETWLSNNISDSIINILGFQLFTRDHVGRLHGGVCIYFRDTIYCDIVSNLHYDVHEVLWANLRPKRLPRNFSNVIVAVVSQPPAADDVAMKGYLVSSLESLEAKYPNWAIILAGDFNRTLLSLLQSAVQVF